MESLLPARLRSYLKERQPVIEKALQDSLPLSKQSGAARLNEALRYTMLPGGKRLRPIVTILGAKLAGADDAQGLALGCAVEFLHSSSLILDDLPGMDNAPTRRQRQALHLEFGEGVAILTALSLLNHAYGLFLRAARPGQAEKLMTAAFACVGGDGMIGGQAVDLELRVGQAAPSFLAQRNLKTSALLRLAMQAGALACGTEADALGKFGACLGQAYQICDDLLDETETGKPAGQDTRHQRANAVSELGRDEALRQAAALVGEGRQALRERFGEQTEAQLLSDIAGFIVRRVGLAQP
jgi:geranylgeranyl diphosphate synthase type II